MLAEQKQGKQSIYSRLLREQTSLSKLFASKYCCYLVVFVSCNNLALLKITTHLSTYLTLSQKLPW